MACSYYHFIIFLKSAFLSLLYNNTSQVHTYTYAWYFCLIVKVYSKTDFINCHVDTHLEMYIICSGSLTGLFTVQLVFFLAHFILLTLNTFAGCHFQPLCRFPVTPRFRSGLSLANTLTHKWTTRCLCLFLPH